VEESGCNITLDSSTAVRMTKERWNDKRMAE
jgi:hypothetical protein